MRSIATLALLSFATAAFAQDAQPRRMVSDACRAEVQKLCPRTEDRAARRQCMMTNRDKISEGCRAELRAAMQARRGMRGGNGDMAAPGAMKTEPKPQ